MKVIFLFAILFVAGCATHLDPLTYRPRNYAGPAWVITASVNTLNNEIIVSIDGNTVIKDNLSFFDGTGEFVQKYQGHTVHVSCHNECTLRINNEYVGKF